MPATSAGMTAEIDAGYVGNALASLAALLVAKTIKETAAKLEKPKTS